MITVLYEFRLLGNYVEVVTEDYVEDEYGTYGFIECYVNGYYQVYTEQEEFFHLMVAAMEKLDNSF